MTTIELINSQKGKKNFSFEVLPPLKGNGTRSLFNTIDKLKEFKPLFINITNHSSEYVYKEHHDGLLERTRIHRRPGTVAIAAAIQYKYDIPVMPHIICAGASRSDIENNNLSSPIYSLYINYKSAGVAKNATRYTFFRFFSENSSVFKL